MLGRELGPLNPGFCDGLSDPPDGREEPDGRPEPDGRLMDGERLEEGRDPVDRLGAERLGADRPPPREPPPPRGPRAIASPHTRTVEIVIASTQEANFFMTHPNPEFVWVDDFVSESFTYFLAATGTGPRRTIITSTSSAFSPPAIRSRERSRYRSSRIGMM